MGDEKKTQQTQPKEGDPVEIPIPEREAVIRDLMKVAPPSQEKEKPDRKPA